ncbi:hypothetical protein NH341_10125 [Tenacibaculum sp. XPcli2-G]|uniref:hypothetical protein n=1 Tax=Tenacibaculum sp. XPcli2-G TaxID=2954503 RepID=UPI00064B4604|nr:hypothetical protein [Tenacibaculum sp. XPcli2-G]MCO7185785.1 hypothetical protein [Tenacibaculum sp. XPcli2-G]
MKAKILNLGTVINKTAQKQINGGTEVICPIGFFYYCVPREVYCYCKLKFVDDLHLLKETI